MSWHFAFLAQSRYKWFEKWFTFKVSADSKSDLKESFLIVKCSLWSSPGAGGSATELWVKEVPDRLREGDAEVEHVVRLLGQHSAVATQKVGIVDRTWKEKKKIVKKSFSNSHYKKIEYFSFRLCYKLFS